MWNRNLAPDGSQLRSATTADEATDIGIALDPIDEEALLATLDAPVTIHRIFIEICGSLSAAAILTDLGYLEREDRDRRDWLEVSQSDWEARLGLSSKEQLNARKLLVARSFIEETRTGMPPRLFFRVQWASINRAMQKAAAARVAARSTRWS